VLQHIAAHLAAAAAAGRPCTTLQAAYDNSRCNSPAAFGYSAGEALDKPAAVEEAMAQLLARVTLAAALHILIATRPAAGHWHDRQAEAEEAAAGRNPYIPSAAATALASSSSASNTAAPQELALAELLPWRLWAMQSVVMGGFC
jgi:hypothetical protein